MENNQINEVSTFLAQRWDISEEIIQSSLKRSHLGYETFIGLQIRNDLIPLLKYRMSQLGGQE